MTGNLRISLKSNLERLLPELENDFSNEEKIILEKINYFGSASEIKGKND